MEYSYASTNLPLYTRFILVLLEVRLHNRFVKTDVPAPIYLLQSINGFPKHAYIVAIFRCKPLRLCPVHFLRQISIEESCLYIHLPKLILIMNGDSYENLNGFNHSNW